MRCAAVIPWLLLSACTADGDVPVPLAVRDSASVRIVENEVPTLGADAWWVPEHPALQIGRVDGEPGYWFSGIMGMTRLSSGRIVVADMGSSQLRFFDAAGRLARVIGRRGEGPGEFRQIARLIRQPGDSLLVVEFNPRAHLFDAQGRFVRMVSLGGAGPFGNELVSTFDDGTYLVRASAMPRPDRRRPASAELFRLGQDGGVRDTIGHFPLVRWAGEGRNEHVVVFSPWPLYAGTGDGFHFAYPDRYEIAGYTSGGALRSLIRRAWRPEPITDMDVEAHREHSLGRAGEDGRPVPERLRQQRERLLAATTYAEQRPAFSRLLTDTEGNLWVQEYSIRQHFQSRFNDTFDESSRWSVFDPGGRWLTDVTLPAHFRVMEIGADYVLGLARDADGVEYVRMYPLAKRG